VAAAAPATYNVSKSWGLTYENGTPTIVPHVEDDVLEVTCRHGDRMTDYKVNKPYLVAGRGGGRTEPESRCSRNSPVTTSASGSR
jgi:hypothetical protein